MFNKIVPGIQVGVHFIRRSFVWLILSIILAACGGEEFEDLQDFVKKSGDDLRGQVEPPPEIKLYDPFPYENNSGLQDPFKSRKPDAKSASGSGFNQPDFNRPKQELEDFPLESMKMVGYLRKGKVGSAIVRASDGNLRNVKVGNYIGMNFGQITSITETEVKIKEMVQEGGGDWKERETSLQLVE